VNGRRYMSLLIGDNLVVSMHYRLTDSNGRELDSSAGYEPMSYLHGAGNIIPGLEKALTGKTEGDSLLVEVAPSEGYGEVMQELIQTVEREEFQDAESLEAGMIFETDGQDGPVRHIRVTKVDGDQITIDANHPLAGVTLNFDVKIVGVRKATAEEITNGYAD
jgi:FKBP-type peptidyl-prolyl cis-trans isomerase SlyD